MPTRPWTNDPYGPLVGTPRAFFDILKLNSWFSHVRTHIPTFTSPIQTPPGGQNQGRERNGNHEVDPDVMRGNTAPGILPIEHGHAKESLSTRADISRWHMDGRFLTYCDGRWGQKAKRHDGDHSHRRRVLHAGFCHLRTRSRNFNVGLSDSKGLVLVALHREVEYLWSGKFTLANYRQYKGSGTIALWLSMLFSTIASCGSRASRRLFDRSSVELTWL